MRSELAEKQSHQLDTYLRLWRNQLNSQRQREAERALTVPNCWRENSAGLLEWHCRSVLG